jgi:ribosome biogenesis protein Nip4
MSRSYAKAVCEGGGLITLFIFIVVAAICQGMPAMYQGGLDEENRKYNLFFNYLGPELRNKIIGNGQTWANVGISSAGSLGLAGLALTGLKDMLVRKTEQELKGFARVASIAYLVISSAPGAFLTYEFFPGLFDSWPFNEMGVNESEINATNITASSAIFASNLMMYGTNVGANIVRHFREAFQIIRSNPRLMRKIVQPLLLIYTYYNQTLQQMASLNLQLNIATEFDMPEAFGPVTAVASAGFGAFIYEGSMQMATDVATWFENKVCRGPNGKLKNAYNDLLTWENLFKLIINILLFLPFLAMFSKFQASAVEMTYHPQEYLADNNNATLALNTTGSFPFNNDAATVAFVDLPAIQCAAVGVYMAWTIPDALKVLWRRFRYGTKEGGADLQNSEQRRLLDESDNESDNGSLA